MADHLKRIPTESGPCSESACYSLADYIITKLDSIHSKFYRQSNRWFYNAKNIAKQSLEDAQKFVDKRVRFCKLTGVNLHKTTQMP